MARSTYKVTLLLLWVVGVREVMTQDQSLPDTAAPELQGMILGSRYNQESENDAIEMGRTAADDMGALMVSPPIQIFRLPQMTSDNDQQDNSRSEFSSYANAREAEFSTRPQCTRYNDALHWYPSSESSGRSAVPRTIPLAPLPTHPLIPGLSQVPLLSPLFQSLTNPGSLLGLGPLLRTPLPSPALRTPLPYTLPALRTPLPYTLPRAPLPTYYIPRMNRVWIPPSPPKPRSSFTPNNYARSANRYKPLIFYV